MSHAFGSSGDKDGNYCVAFHNDGHTEVRFIINNTQKKEDIIRVLKKQIKDIDKSWKQK